MIMDMGTTHTEKGRNRENDPPGDQAGEASVAMETITRKSLLYKSRLGFYCVNHVQGCRHGCRYPCYAYQMATHYGRAKSYEDWRRPKLVVNAVELLEKELSRMRNKPDSVHLCLTADPFMTGYPEVGEASLKIIGTINAHGIPCSALTKGILPKELADHTIFRKDNRYQISLISLNEDFRKHWEPGASPYRERIQALKYLHGHDCRTEIHMEPYPTPNVIEQDLEEILDEVVFVKYIYFSGWNYNNEVGKFRDRNEFYATQARIARGFCLRHGIEYDGPV
jgi:DNA repair photolyase